MANLIFLFIILLISSCSSSDEENNIHATKKIQQGEYIYRKHNEFFNFIPPQKKMAPKRYLWDNHQKGNLSKITKEFFRCKGCSLNPYHTVQIKGETIRQYDCEGSEKHSLPLRNGKEFIYSILLELINYIQDMTERHVVITCGHRCIEHNTYADPSPANQYSKHMIGAEVSFYVQGLEEHPEQVVKIIQNYYKISPSYNEDKNYQIFKRYEKKDTNVSTQPWFNKEIFIKLYEKDEGRNFDNRHPYPYISIQVRHDRETNESVIYSWDKAFKNYHRW